MSAGIGDGSSAASYDRFNASVNTNISITSDANTSIGDKSLVSGTKESQKLESPRIEREMNADYGISTDGVSNSIDAPLSVNDRALTVIVGKHSDTAL
ncbi:MAG: hypothetical protein LBD33_01665 [Puniceicoccales bacterium]|jgi:hypothetical protein|nr:hypothetical protein [Puniceicoccales bacterium]